MNPAYAAELGFVTRKTNIAAQKIDSLTLETYGIVIVGFLVQDRLEKVRFFEKTFLLANTSIKVFLRISFLILSDTNIWFVKKKLTWRNYITAKALPTTKKIEFIDKREFAIAAMNEDSETFVRYVVAVEAELLILLHPRKRGSDFSIVGW